MVKAHKSKQAPRKGKEKEEVAVLPRLSPGRPRAFNSVEEFQERAEAYFEECNSVRPYPRVPTKAGLAKSLGVSKETLSEYGSKPEYSDAIKAIYLEIEDEWIQRLARPHATGAIFYLKNAFRYRDILAHEGNTTMVFMVPREIAEKHAINIPEAPQLAAPVNDVHATDDETVAE